MLAQYTAAALVSESKGLAHPARVLTNDPATGVMRHADAGYESARACAREHALDLPMV